MFGYIQPDAPYLFKKDETLYKALYCGLCKSIGAGCGQRARSALTYDMAFMSALVHNIRREDVNIKRAHCALHVIKKRPIAVPDEITVMLGCINTALAYYKLCDDKADGDKKGVLRHLYKKGMKRAAKKHKQAVDIIRMQMAVQSKIEQAGCSIIEQASEPTAVMLRELSVYVLGEYSTEETEALFYDIGKWVYLIDALDDYDKDVKKNRFNVFYNAFGAESKKQAVEENIDELTFLFDSLFADMRERLSKIEFAFNHDLTDNIILRGIPLKTRAILNGCKNKNQCDNGDKYEQEKS
ncbi:MAG: hypothetical protein K2N23_04210 [Clostridia bacterium]|nr:hypothetical protein [Clostridia bacterium]